MQKLGRRRRPQLTSPTTLCTLRESIPRQIDKKSRGPQAERSLELSAPICKKEVTSTIFLLEASLSALDGGVDRLHQSFLSLVGLSLSLTNAGAVLIPPSSTTEMG